MEELNAIRTRDQIPQEATWAPEVLYISDAAWEEDLQALEQSKDTLSAYCGHLGESAENLNSYLRCMETTNE